MTEYKMPTREQNSNKGTFGKVLNFSGSKNYIGAAYLSTVSILKTGGGFAALATEKDIIKSVSTLLPEAVYLSRKEGLKDIKNFSVILIGCGLGLERKSVNLFKKVIKSISNSNAPTIIDADGLNILSKNNLKLPRNTIITPHPLEAARLLGVNLEEILSTFNTYMISVKNHDVDENEIISRFDNYLALQNEVSNLIDSYINRVNNSDIFDPNTGANEIVVQFCNMNLALADTLMFINSELDNLEINKDADLKFSMIDLYLNIVLTTLDDTTLDINGLQVIRNEINLTTINNFFELENSIIITPSNTTNFESDNNNFILHYENVDKVNFAENFADNINRINIYSDNLSETEKAIFYFKAIYNLL